MDMRVQERYLRHSSIVELPAIRKPDPFAPSKGAIKPPPGRHFYVRKCELCHAA
jgi:hypothetical protein